MPDCQLYRRGRTPLWLALSWRALLALALISIALAVHRFDRDGLRQSSGEAVTFADILYFTMNTVTTVGYGDIVPVTQQSRLFDTFVLTPIRLFVWLIFLGTAYDFLLKRVWTRWRMAVLQRQLPDHVVIAGFGNSGSEATTELIRRGAHPDTIVVIDNNPAALRNAEALDVAVLTARRIAPFLTISSVICSLDNEAIARQAGANTVINRPSFAGLLLAGSAHGMHLADYMADPAATDGRILLRE